MRKGQQLKQYRWHSTILKTKLRSVESGKLLAEGETTHIVANSKMKSRALPQKYMTVFRAAVGSP